MSSACRLHVVRMTRDNSSALSLLASLLALWSMDEKVGKLDNRAEAEFKIAVAKYYLIFGQSSPELPENEN